MDTVLKLGLMGLVMGTVMVMLYKNGWMILSQKTALTFVGGRGGKSATFTRCSGEIRRIVRFREDRSYAFHLESALTDGEMRVLLLGPGKEELLCLTGGRPDGAVMLEKNKRYTLVLRFLSASGSYTLDWD